jgi:hypothetical protein
MRNAADSVFHSRSSTSLRRETASALQTIRIGYCISKLCRSRHTIWTKRDRGELKGSFSGGIWTLSLSQPGFEPRSPGGIIAKTACKGV